MPICPKCGEEIDRLLFEQEVIERGTITFEEGRLKFKEDETEANPLTFIAKCPKCEWELFYGNDDCEDFLKIRVYPIRPKPHTP